MPDNWGEALSKYSILFKKIQSFPKLGKEFLSNPSTVSEAYELCEIMESFNEQQDSFYKFINTGTIDRYVSFWGYNLTRYIKKDYFKPIVLRDKYNKKFSKRRSDLVSNKK